MFQLTSKSGRLKGACWAIGDAPLVIGRDYACDVVVGDPIVSRRHCEIHVASDGLRLRDLESSNATLVNGLPVRECILRSGDEIAVGYETFLIVADPRSMESGAGPGEPPTTTIGGEGVVYVSGSMPDESPAGRLRSVRDLADLFRVSRELGSAESPGDLRKRLWAVLKSRFSPGRAELWLTLQGAGRPECHAWPGTPASTPNTMPKPAADCLEDGRGRLILRAGATAGTENVRTTLLLAPLVVGSTCIGVIMIEASAPHPPYTEPDLEYLTALGYALAPLFHAIEQVEQLRRENEALRATSVRRTRLVGSSPVMEKLIQLLNRVGPAPGPVLILGETGTGKELVAKLLHELSPRAAGPLVPVNCAAIPRDLFESEFLGHDKGAFTGATGHHLGFFERSDGGTLFLDEVGDLSPECQARILRALETRRFNRLGGVKEVEVDCRIIAATNRDIVSEVREGRFRGDLYHRLAGFQIVLPPLRDRRSDIPELTLYFLDLARLQAKRPIRGIAPEALDYLCEREWSGNVRELRMCVERAVGLSEGETITVDDVRGAVFEGANAACARLDDLERMHIQRVLHDCRGNISKTAAVLGIGRSTLYEKLTRYGIKT